MADLCSICRDGLDHGDLAVFECIHIHHNNCIQRWLSQRARSRWSCPICRRRIRQIQVIRNQNNEETPVVNSRGSNRQAMNLMWIDPQATSSRTPIRPREIEVIELSSDSEELDSSHEVPRNPQNSHSNNLAPPIAANSGISAQQYLIDIRPVGPSAHPVPNITGIIIESSPDDSLNEYFILQPMENGVSNESSAENSTQNSLPGPSTSQVGENSSRGNSNTLISLPSQAGAGSTTDGEALRGISSTCYNCPLCPVSFRMKISFNRHLSRHHPRAVPCKYPSCGQFFSTRAALELHANFHLRHLLSSNENSE